MGDSQSGTSFGPDWKIELEQRSSRTWILHVTNSGSVASSFIPLGLSILSDSELQHVKALTLRALNKSNQLSGIRSNTLPGTLLNPGESVTYELWLALAKEHESLQGDSIELKLVLSYLRPTLGAVELIAGQDSEILTLSINHSGGNTLR